MRGTVEHRAELCQNKKEEEEIQRQREKDWTFPATELASKENFSICSTYEAFVQIYKKILVLNICFF